MYYVIEKMLQNFAARCNTFPQGLAVLKRILQRHPGHKYCWPMAAHMSCFRVSAGQSIELVARHVAHRSLRRGKSLASHRRAPLGPLESCGFWTWHCVGKDAVVFHDWVLPCCKGRWR